MRFEKVSFEQFKKDMITSTFYNVSFHEINKCEHIKDYCNKRFKDCYDNIKFPKRSSTCSAGYDFYLPMSFSLNGIDKEAIYCGKDFIKIPTGIRCVDMPSNVVLKMYARSGLGTKYGFTPKNGTGIIDSDYAKSDNEGHIIMVMETDKAIELEAGTAFCQGIFSHYLIVDDDDTNGIRNGGFGSSDKAQ